MPDKEHPLAGMKVTEIAKMPGVGDITPITARGKFAISLSLEAQGKHEEAASKLDEAIAALD